MGYILIWIFPHFDFWLYYFLIRKKNSENFKKILYITHAQVEYYRLLIFKFCHRVKMSCMYNTTLLHSTCVFLDYTYIRRNRLYPTKALGVTSSIWFCSKRLKEKNGKSLFLKVRLCTYLLFAGGRVKLLPENSVIIIISAPSIIHKVKSSWSYTSPFGTKKIRTNSNYFFGDIATWKVLSFSGEDKNISVVLYPFLCTYTQDIT